jgi:hypothetical protein
MKVRIRASSLPIGLLLATTAWSGEPLTGKVVKVADGDTLTLLVFGNRAKQALSDNVFGWVVRADNLGNDKYGRTLGIIRLGDTNINANSSARGGFGGISITHRVTVNWRPPRNPGERLAAGFGETGILCHRGNGGRRNGSMHAVDSYTRPTRA